MAGVLVFCEIADGKVKKASREALTIGRSLAAAAGVDLAAFAGDRAAAKAAGAYGVKTLFAASLGPYNTERCASAMQSAVAKMQPAVILFGATANGRDLAPRLAARLNVGVASDVDALEWADGKLRARRSIYSGRIVAKVELAASPAMATTRLNAFPAEESGGAEATVEEIAVPPESKVKLLETKVPQGGELSIAEADIIVSGGRGLKEAANFSLIRELAQALGGAVGASRATVDAGWIDHQHQVGQTGRVVSPNLYIAAGISGAIQHLAGMASSKHIVVVNKDPEAPIFRVADLGVVGDLFQVIPAVTAEVRKIKAGH